MDAAEQPKPSFLELILNVINGFPNELRDALTKIRELDLEVENGMDKQNKQMDEFFQNAEQVSAEEREKLFESIKKGFETIIEDADAKIELADALHMGLGVYLGKIDESIAEFKEDLERDDPGITAIIERKVAAETLPTQNDVPPRKRNARKKVAKKKKW